MSEDAARPIPHFSCCHSTDSSGSHSLFIFLFKKECVGCAAVLRCPHQLFIKSQRAKDIIGCAEGGLQIMNSPLFLSTCTGGHYCSFSSELCSYFREGLAAVQTSQGDENSLFLSLKLPLIQETTRNSAIHSLISAILEVYLFKDVSCGPNGTRPNDGNVSEWYSAGGKNQ